MNTILLVEHLANIFLDIVLPVVVLWIGYQIKSWLPAEAAAHEKVDQLAQAVKR